MASRVVVGSAAHTALLRVTGGSGLFIGPLFLIETNFMCANVAIAGSVACASRRQFARDRSNVNSTIARRPRKHNTVLGLSVLMCVFVLLSLFRNKVSRIC